VFTCAYFAAPSILSDCRSPVPPCRTTPASSRPDHGDLPSGHDANNATAQIRFSNPGPTPANVTLKVTLAKYHVPNQTLTVPPYGSAVASITPNPAIPVAGYASVAMTSSQPVIRRSRRHGKRRRVKRADLARTGVLGGRLHGPGIRRGDAHQHLVTIDLDRRHDTARCDVASGAITPGGGFDRECAQLDPALADLRGVVMIVNASRPTLLVALTLPTRPAGMTVVRLRRPVGSAAANRAAVV